MTHAIKRFVAAPNETTERLFVMRTMLKSVLVALAAALALSTTVVATASAARPQWEVKEGGAWKVLETGSRKITISQQGSQVLLYPSGYHSEITCEKLEGKGGIYQYGEGPGTGEFTELKYTGCGAVSVGRKCGWVSSPEQPNGTIVMGNDPGVLVAKEGNIYYEVQENTTKKEFTHVVVSRLEQAEGGGTCGLITGGYNTLRGSFLGKINNATSELEFAGEGTLELATNPLKYLGNDLLEVEGGGAIRAS